jgi:hypothetical protein
MVLQRLASDAAGKLAIAVFCVATTRRKHGKQNHKIKAGPAEAMAQPEQATFSRTYWECAYVVLQRSARGIFLCGSLCNKGATHASIRVYLPLWVEVYSS